MNQVRVRLDDGSEFELRELNGDNPFILIFLRHYGCIFCRYQVAQLRPAADLPIYFVGMGSVEETSRFRSRMRSPHRFISDPERTLYKRFGVPRAIAGQVFNLRAVGAGVRATLSGQFQGRATSDPMQLGAAFILDGGGNVCWSLVPSDVSEIVGANTLREQLARVGQLESAVSGKNDPSGDHPPSGD
jgi:hypothetical protein